MGVMEWWLTYGPGSPGSIARTMARAYVRIQRAQPELSSAALLRATLNSRYQAIGTLEHQQLEKILLQANGTLSDLVAQVWQYENPRARRAFFDATRVYIKCIGIIDTEVRKIAPDAP